MINTIDLPDAVFAFGSDILQHNYYCFPLSNSGWLASPSTTHLIIITDRIFPQNDIRSIDCLKIKLDAVYPAKDEEIIRNNSEWQAKKKQPNDDFLKHYVSVGFILRKIALQTAVDENNFHFFLPSNKACRCIVIENSESAKQNTHNFKWVTNQNQCAHCIVWC